MTRTTMQESGAAVADRAQTMIDAAKKTVDGFDTEAVCGMDELEMAAAIGRLTATLGMLIAAFEQPRTS